MLNYIGYKINLQVKSSIVLSYDCTPQELPKHLTLVSDYIKKNDIKSYRVLINEDSFKHVPSLDEVMNIKGENPALLPKLLKLLKKYDSIQAIKFEMHDYNYCNRTGSIMVYGLHTAKEEAYEFCKEIDKLYNVGIDSYSPDYTICAALFINSKVSKCTLRKGVDW